MARPICQQVPLFTIGTFLPAFRRHFPGGHQLTNLLPNLVAVMDVFFRLEYVQRQPSLCLAVAVAGITMIFQQRENILGKRNFGRIHRRSHSYATGH